MLIISLYITIHIANNEHMYYIHTHIIESKNRILKTNINTSNAHNLKIIILVHETTMKAHRKNKRD
jgi:hypothetical protein